MKTALCHDRAELAHREERPFADFSVEGLLLKNEELLEAQDPDGNGEFLPVKRKKDGSYSGASSLIAAEKLGVLSRRVEKIFASLAESLKEGKIGAVPLSHGKDKNVCTYCDYLPICKTGTKNPRPYRRKIGDSLVEEKGGEEA